MWVTPVWKASSFPQLPEKEVDEEGLYAIGGKMGKDDD